MTYTPTLDAIAADEAALAAEAAQVELQAAKDAAKREAAEAYLTDDVLEALAAAQARVERCMTEYITAYITALQIRNDCAAAVSTLNRLGDNPTPILPALYLRASVGSDHELRGRMDDFRRLALAVGEA